MAAEWLEASHAQLAEAVGRRMSSKPGSVFGAVGEAACRQHAAATLTALRVDLTTGKTEALRAVVRALVEELLPRGLGFSDLRYYINSVKAALHGALAAAGEERQAVDAWLLELTMVCSMHFVVHREEAVQQRSAQLEVKRLESQLDEMKAAFAEKSELLERIRQTSTPIAPVVEGILVVPLVGVFDTLRAELLTERLLQAVGQARARVVILDIGGVPVFDVEAADMIVRLAKAVRLLGTELILVGVSPATAGTIVALGVDLTGLRTQGSLQDGLAVALRLRRLKIAPL
jgi:anti-anti-sigma factor